jgi:hypothetical protein
MRGAVVYRVGYHGSLDAAFGDAGVATLFPNAAGPVIVPLCDGAWRVTAMVGALPPSVGVAHVDARGSVQTTTLPVLDPKSDGWTMTVHPTTGDIYVVSGSTAQHTIDTVRLNVR